MGSGKPNSGQFEKGQQPWNKGKKTGLIPWNKGKPSPMKGKHRTFTEEWKRNLSKGHKGKKLSEETKKKMGVMPPGFKGHNFGKKLSAETRKKIREKRWEQAPIPQEGNKFELSVFNALREGGIEFEQHKKIIGIPDIFIKPNLCIFLDSDYHHANPSKYPDAFLLWPSKGVTAKSKRLYDKKIRDELRAEDYKIITGLWYSDWKKDKEKFFQKILKSIKEAKRKRI